MPIKDKSQDWSLLFGEENEFGTVLKFVRKINTCDDTEDEVIRVKQFNVLIIIIKTLLHERNHLTNYSLPRGPQHIYKSMLRDIVCFKV